MHPKAGHAGLAIVVAAGIGAVAVGGGAVSAHLLEGEAALRMETAVRYAMWHALALLAASALGLARPIVKLLFLGGIVLFSGGLAAQALGAPPAFSAIVPWGGSAFILGWLALALSSWRQWRTARRD